MKNKNKSKNLDFTSQQKSLRILPGIIIVILQWVAWLIIPKFVYSMQATATMVFGALIGGFAFLVWWIFFSRSPKKERWIALALMILALLIVPQFAHESIRLGMEGLMFYVFAIPTLSMAFVIWATLSKYFSKQIRVISMVFTILISCGIWILIQSNGLSGNARADLSWRWNKGNKERLFVQKEALFFTETKAEWPGFRGPDRDGTVRKSHIETDWSAHPPVELWRWPIGAGCSSFAVHGNLFYTQEQSGEYEIVSCYNLTNGEPVWRHRDSTRFYDQHAGAGPRSTPTLCGEQVFTLGATGILNALNADDGKVIWSRNASDDTKSKDSGWGFTCSPLLVENVVIVSTAGTLIAYDKNSGDQVWISEDKGDSYSSPHLMNINGVPQVLSTSAKGVTSFFPADGSVFWEHLWPADTRILQPAIIADGEILVNSGMKRGMRKIQVSKKLEQWTIKENWTSTKMRSDFNDFVVHKEHIYGFEGPTIACLNLNDGTRKWKGKRYGGQLILLAEQDLLLILSEKGELALVEANPKHFKELGSVAAIEGKTWNHPVLVNNTLLVRNAKEMLALNLAK